MTGATGATGAAPSFDYAYVYNEGGQIVTAGSDVTFDTNGLLSGFTHTTGTSSITSADGGTYAVDFNVSGVEPSQFAISLNGTPLSEATYGSEVGDAEDTGQVILSLQPGDVISVTNHTSVTPITLETDTGGTSAAVNASA